MIDNNTPIETSPIIEKTSCKILVYLISFSLNFAPLTIGLYVGYKYDYIIGIGIGLFLYLVAGIISSKLRVVSIPPDQYERSFSNHDIALWYVSKNICF